MHFQKLGKKLFLVLARHNAVDKSMLQHKFRFLEFLRQGFSRRLLDDARALVNRVLNECADNGIREWGTLKTRMKDGLSRLLYDRTRRSPMILPIIMEV